jgi:hypothetical protein
MEGADHLSSGGVQAHFDAVTGWFSAQSGRCEMMALSGAKWGGGGLASRATQAGRVGGASGWWHRCGLYAMRSRAPVGVGTMALSPRRRCRGADRWP